MHADLSGSIVLVSRMDGFMDTWILDLPYQNSRLAYQVFLTDVLDYK